MATDETTSEEFYEQMKTSVRQSFARLYAALKARELRTLRQMQAVKQQCETSHAHSAVCLRSLLVSYDNEQTITANIQHFGELHLDKLNLEGDTFLVEDYVCPNEDHMYSYKDIDDIAANNPRLDLDIEEAALKQITESDCVCSVYITPEEASKKFREDDILKPKPSELPSEISSSPNELQDVTGDVQISDIKNTSNDNTENSPSGEEITKINPTEEWLNCIKSQIETEPTQVNDVMEHSTIVC